MPKLAPRCEYIKHMAAVADRNICPISTNTHRMDTAHPFYSDIIIYQAVSDDIPCTMPNNLPQYGKQARETYSSASQHVILTMYFEYPNGYSKRGVVGINAPLAKSGCTNYTPFDTFLQIEFRKLHGEQNIYAVNAVDYPKREDVAGVVILARLVGNIIVIEEDMTDKKLVDALMQRGIPRDQIVLAYDGESIPDAEKFQLDA